MEDFLKVGIITSTHGIKGEVKVYPTTDDARRFKKLTEVLLEKDGQMIALQIESVKFFKQMVILKFKGLDSINNVERYRQKELYVARENAVPLGRNEYFIADLIGLKALDEEEKELGVLEEVIQTGANDVYVIKTRDGRELLLPAIRQCILAVNVEDGFIRVHILDGLLD
nr:ribosome maturation factor RimM [uncultured Acetatifactor sp.]